MLAIGRKLDDIGKDMERLWRPAPAGEPSKWLTLFAARVLAWWN